MAKVCLIGPKGVGKSTIASKYDRMFSMFLKGTSIANCKMMVGNSKVDLQIWDIFGGDERLLCMAPIFYKSMKGGVCLFDISSKESFLDIQAWVISVLQYATEDCILVIVGNKKDLNDTRTVSFVEGHKYAESVGATYFETCASTGEGLDAAFLHIATCLVHQKDCYNSYHAKLAITSSKVEYCGCTMRRKTKKLKSEKSSKCFPCLMLG